MTGLVLALAAGFANDAAISEGGTPRLLDGHPTVRMVSETIVVTVGTTKTTADCRFTFANDGPACTVKMGFPDHAFGAADPEEEASPEDLKKPPKSGAMTSFQSWVDGAKVKTTLERGESAGEYWHTKSVTFKARGRTLVRDTYAMPDSSAIVIVGESGGPNAHFAGYVVHTGSSWKGTIGRSEVTFILPRSVKAVVRLADVTHNGDVRHYKKRLAQGTVAYRGMARPEVKGRTITFVRTNWRPTKAGDVELWFGHEYASER